MTGAAEPRVRGPSSTLASSQTYFSTSCGSSGGSTASSVQFGKCVCTLGEIVNPRHHGDRRAYSTPTWWGPSRRRSTLGGGYHPVPVRNSGKIVKLVRLATATMSGGSGSMQDFPLTPVFESPPSLPHGNGGYQADLINLTLDSPGELLGGSPPKRTRQAESSPGGQSDSTGLEENVTMEAIARTLQHQLQQERQVLTGEIQRAMSQVKLKGGRYREDPGGQARGRRGNAARPGGGPKEAGGET